jgi:hypothetical protein
MTKGKRTKRSAASHPRTRAAERRGIAERGGWVDQQVAEILKLPIPLSEKARRVYAVLAAKPPIPGDHLPPIEVIRNSLVSYFHDLANEPDSPLTPEKMPGTIYLVLEQVLQSWTPTNAHKRRDRLASFITYLERRLKWECLRYLEEARKRSREIPLSVFLERNWGDQDAIDEDHVQDLGFVPITDELL